MPNDFDFKNYKTIEEFGKTIEGSKYFHDLYLKAVNHPVRREILNIINERKKISYDSLLQELMEKKIIDNNSSLNYNIDFLAKALCLNIINEKGIKFFEITQGGKVVEYL